MKIGNVDIPHGLFLAPLAGYTDYGMRSVCRSFGAEYVVTEMVSAKAVVYHDKKTLTLARIRPEEAPCALQIFGSEPQILAEAAGILSVGVPDGIPPCAIDINMGCPVPKVFSNGEGSALMKHPERIYDIVRAVKAAISLPVTVKIRAGVDSSHINAVECALAAEEGGACAVAVHGRTRAQMYAGEADRGVIRAVKEALTVPVIANGDITSADAALSMKRDTGADGLMIARGAIGNPFLFDEICHALDGEPYTPPTPEERVETALRQLSASIADRGEVIAVKECRKQMSAFVAGFRGAAALRAHIHTADTVEDVRAAFERVLDACRTQETHKGDLV